MNDRKATVHFEIRANVAYLTLARPDASNTIDLQLARELLKSVVEIEAAGARAPTWPRTFAS
jgi:enoyl-CoA hydratase/carnithine racemase